MLTNVTKIQDEIRDIYQLHRVEHSVNHKPRDVDELDNQS